MAQYTLAANGTPIGTFEAVTEEEAILAYVKDAGYASVEDAANVLGQTTEKFLGDIDIEQV